MGEWRHPIGPVLAHYGADQPEERTGWQKLRCPFHDDSHASATVNTDDNVFVCFACGVKGNTYKIISLQEGVTYREAISKAEEITGTSSPQVRGGHSSRRGLPSEAGIVARRRPYIPPRRLRDTRTGT